MAKQLNDFAHTVRTYTPYVLYCTHCTNADTIEEIQECVRAVNFSLLTDDEGGCKASKISDCDQ